MIRTIGYQDAVTLLGGTDPRVERLQRLSRGALAVGTAGTSEFLTSLFGDELASLSNGLVTDTVGRLRGLKRFDRNQRLAAAHAVLVTAAFFDAAAAQLDLPFDLADAELDIADQASIISGSRAEATLAGFGTHLLTSGLPVPTPDRPFEQVLSDLRDHYARAAASLLVLLQRLALWDRLSETDQTRAVEAVQGLPPQAVVAYEADYRRLATDVPEFEFWADSTAHRATQAGVATISLGLSRIESMLTGLGEGAVPDARRQELASLYRRRLDVPILASDDAPEGVSIPSLGAAYVTPSFRATSAVGDLSSESSWEGRELLDGLEEFLVGHFTGVRATRAPLLVLGQPGSGKSLLTRILAARLPAETFLVVRVVLRDVPADADVQTQVEHAIRTTTGESLSWPALARSAGDALPVLLFDGFDELLQATGVTQTDYLERIAAFQQREADMGRPVAALVTTRTAVADQARSHPDSVAIRLEPFHDEQVRAWLSVWNGLNAPHLDALGRKELPPEVALRHGDLASQPLLLLMLALYDADANALQASDESLSQADLYERLLTRFAEREVEKSSGHLTSAEKCQAVERELTRLSVVAFAMFNRGRQWVTESELDQDLPVLLPEPSTTPHAPSSLRASLSAGEQAIGRFFFVHRSEAEQGGHTRRSFEFLHATFGEYLVARLVVVEMDLLAETAALNERRGRSRAVLDDAMLHALLSFEPLARRSTVVDFLEDRFSAWSAERRGSLMAPLLSLFAASLYPRTGRTIGLYAPVVATIARRPALHSCNLVLLMAILNGSIQVHDLFPSALDVRYEWRRLTSLWRSHLDGESWRGVLEHLSVRKEFGDRGRKMTVHFARFQNTSLDMLWDAYDELIDFRPGEDFALKFYSGEEVLRHVHFQSDRRTDLVAHAMEPVLSSWPDLLSIVIVMSDGRARSAANCLIALWKAAGTDVPDAELADLRQACVAFFDHARDSLPQEFFDITDRLLAEADQRSEVS